MLWLQSDLHLLLLDLQLFKLILNLFDLLTKFFFFLFLSFQPFLCLLYVLLHMPGPVFFLLIRVVSQLSWLITHWWAGNVSLLGQRMHKSLRLLLNIRFVLLGVIHSVASTNLNWREFVISHFWLLKCYKFNY